MPQAPPRLWIPWAQDAKQFHLGEQMGDQSVIRSSCSGQLQEYFDAHIPKKRIDFWARAAGADTEDIALDFGNFKIPLPANLIRHFAKTYLYGAAAQRWLRPHAPCVTLAQVEKLQRDIGLDGTDPQDFANELIDYCNQLQRDHPRLKLWIERRVALLQMLSDPPGEQSNGSLQLAMLLRNRLLQLVAYLHGPGPYEWVVQFSDELAATALQAAGQEVGAVLCDGPYHYNANLMIPVEDAPHGAPPFSNTACERAEHLWRSCGHFSKRLLVASETEDAGHLGFWVPLVRGSDGENLPGAPSAFFSMHGNGVFKDDLPDLAGFEPDLTAAWHQYMADYFEQDLFVSLPLLVPRTGTGGSAGTTVASILNVNVLSAGEKIWRRAYHKEWLDIISSRVAPFVETALYALLVKAEATRREGKRVVRLAIGDHFWNVLPGVGVERRIEEKKQ